MRQTTKFDMGRHKLGEITLTSGYLCRQSGLEQLSLLEDFEEDILERLQVVSET